MRDPSATVAVDGPIVPVVADHHRVIQTIVSMKETETIQDAMTEEIIVGTSAIPSPIDRATIAHGPGLPTALPRIQKNGPMVVVDIVLVPEIGQETSDEGLTEFGWADVLVCLHLIHSNSAFLPKKVSTYLHWDIDLSF